MANDDVNPYPYLELVQKTLRPHWPMILVCRSLQAKSERAVAYNDLELHHIFLWMGMGITVKKKKYRLQGYGVCWPQPNDGSAAIPIFTSLDHGINVLRQNLRCLLELPAHVTTYANTIHNSLEEWLVPTGTTWPIWKMTVDSSYLRLSEIIPEKLCSFQMPWRHMQTWHAQTKPVLTTVLSNNTGILPQTPSIPDMEGWIVTFLEAKTPFLNFDTLKTSEEVPLSVASSVPLSVPSSVPLSVPSSVPLSVPSSVPLSVPWIPQDHSTTWNVHSWRQVEPSPSAASFCSETLSEVSPLSRSFFPDVHTPSIRPLSASVAHLSLNMQPLACAPVASSPQSSPTKSPSRYATRSTSRSPSPVTPPRPTAPLLALLTPPHNASPIASPTASPIALPTALPTASSPFTQVPLFDDPTDDLFRSTSPLLSVPSVSWQESLAHMRNSASQFFRDQEFELYQVRQMWQQLKS